MKRRDAQRLCELCGRTLRVIVRIDKKRTRNNPGDQTTRYADGAGRTRLIRLKMRQLVWLDLCSGLGGASQPALDRGWKVIRVDIDPRFKPDIVADVRALPFKPFLVDVLWASPPCQEFSKHGLRCFYPNPPEPDLSMVLGVKAEIARLRPQYWCVENVWASRTWLSRIFGQVRAKPPGHALWSNLGFLLPPIKAHKSSSVQLNARRIGAIPAKQGDFRKDFRGQRERHATGIRSFVENRKDAPAEAARIPYEIGAAICRAVEQRTQDASLSQ